jgi:hypothetical protein
MTNHLRFDDLQAILHPCQQFSFWQLDRERVLYRSHAMSLLF